MGIFSDAQGQLTPQSLVESGGISKSFEIFIMVVLLTCKYEADPIKMKALECLQDFLHYNLWELSVAMETRVPIRFGTKTNQPFPFGFDLPFGCGDIHV